MQTITIDINDFKTICERRGFDFESSKGCIVSVNNNQAIVDVNHKSYPNPKDARKVVIQRKGVYDRSKKATLDIGEGAGTELKKILSWMNIKASDNCSCNNKAKHMNKMGIDWCKDNSELLCSWLEEEASKRKIPFVKYAAQKLIQLAIYRAERKQQKCSN